MWAYWTLLACLCFGSGAALQKHGVATRLPPLSLHSLIRDWRSILRALFLNRFWLLGGFANICGSVFMILAVNSGEISVVQPLINANVLVAILAGVLLLKERLSRVEWVGASMLLSGAAMVALSADTQVEFAGYDPYGLCLISLICAALASILPLATRMLGRGNPEPFLAVSAGLWFGLSTVFLKVLTMSVWDWWIVFEWSLWALIAVNVVGFILYQMAFSHGRVSLVSPLTTIASMVPPVIVGLLTMSEEAHPLKLWGITVVAVGTILLFAKSRNSIVLNGTGSES